MRYFLFLIFILYFINPIFSQGRKREKSNVAHRNMRRHPKTSPWIYRKTSPGIVQERELPKLFKWNITKNKRFNNKTIEKQNKQRTKNRVRGNMVFHRRKYF